MPINPYGANLQLTTSPAVAAVIRDYWEKDWLDLLRETTLPFSKVGTPAQIPSGNGNAVTFHDMPAIAPLTADLTEGTTPDPTVPTVSAVQGVTKQRGMYIAVSDRAWNEAMLDFIKTVTSRVNQNMIESVEAYHYKSACDTTNIFYGDGTVTTEAAITAAMTLKVATFRRLNRAMMKAHVPKGPDGYWTAIISPDSALSLFSDSEWIAMSQADKNRSADAEKGVVGYLYGFKIIETTVIESGVDNGAGVKISRNIAHNGTGFKRIQIAGESPSVLVKEPGVDGGPLNQRGTVGWKGTIGSKVTINDCVCKVITADPA